MGVAPVSKRVRTCMVKREYDGVAADEALMGNQDLKEGSLTSMRMAYLLFRTGIARRHDDRK